MSPRQLEALRLVAEGRFFPVLAKEDDGWHARWRAATKDDNPWLDECVRRAVKTALSSDAENQRHETLHDAWVMALASETGLVRWDEAECAAFARELEAWAGLAVPDSAARASIVFGFASRDGRFFVECAAPRGRRALAELGLAVGVFGPLRGLRSAGEGRVLRVELSRGEAETFLRTGARALRAAGYGVDGCEVAARVTAEVDLGESGPAGRNAGGDGKGGDAAQLEARLRVRVAGEEVGAEEIRFLLDQGSTLVFFRNRWIEVDRGILREALRALERTQGRRLSRMEAVAFAQGVGAAGRLEIETARAHGWLRGLLNELRAKGEYDGADFRRQVEEFHTLAPAFNGRLRAYQARGVAWIRFLAGHGFGALLADEMGLGKTIQTLAWLCLDVAQATPALIVAPLTLIGNWRHEIEAFAPSLRLYVHHGDTRHRASGFLRAAREAQIVLTSYTLLVKDYSQISEVAWGSLVLDEAQTIKNADTRAARAVCALGAPRRLALTGTPVENAATDIWSLEAFLNPGFLPARKDFAERFAKPLAQDPHCGAGKRLRRALEPFMLRRLKSDAGVAEELGPKREIREYCELSAAERAEYEAALEDYRASERRNGDIFVLVNRLKLVCDGMVGTRPGARQVSGKLARLLDLVEGIFAAGESVLVFTQYAKVGAMIRDALAERFKAQVPFLHGGLSAAAREAEIAAFNSPGPRAFVLSLRAGGFGLNLVKATHVVHYDRWWNPAVEAQATDRAHRIGQTSVVFVHLFIASGTIEDRVDAILEKKLATAGSLVVSGEAFLSSMSAEEFERTVALDG